MSWSSRAFSSNTAGVVAQLLRDVRAHERDPVLAVQPLADRAEHARRTTSSRTLTLLLHEPFVRLSLHR
jgi:hypothetical protein